MRTPHAQPGYIFLISVLVIGVIASATSLSLLLLGWAAEQNGVLFVQSNQAYEYAHTCAELSLRELRRDLGYIGDTTMTFPSGSCAIERIAGGGSERRVLCVTGYSGDSVRRLQIQIRTLFPTVKITKWEEVTSFTMCP